MLAASPAGEVVVFIAEGKASMEPWKILFVTMNAVLFNCHVAVPTPSFRTMLSANRTSRLAVVSSVTIAGDISSQIWIVFL